MQSLLGGVIAINQPPTSLLNLCECLPHFALHPPISSDTKERHVHALPGKPEPRPLPVWRP
eukprot:1603732-Prorocentrum_lima.AAC.1